MSELAAGKGAVRVVCPRPSSAQHPGHHPFPSLRLPAFKRNPPIASDVTRRGVTDGPINIGMVSKPAQVYGLAPCH